ncbi:MAG: outer membrane beta-barrel domain-containing protein [Pseudomonadota bacterium]
MRSRTTLLTLLPALLGLHASVAAAQDTVTPIDLGMLRDSEISVVQKRLYSMEKRSELGLHLGLMPFDAYTVAPLARGTFTFHTSETIGFEVGAAGGWGFKNGAYRELEGPAYGIAAEAYRFLGQASVALEWAPAYAKLNWRGKKVYHHDFYVLGGAGLTVEQCVLPTHDMAFAPGATLGLGLRVFHGKRAAWRFELRDDVFLESRDLTATTAVKQNVSLSLGLSRFSKGH